MAIKSDNPNRLAVDVQSTQALRAKFKSDPKAGLKEAAQQFEAMFLQMVMKSMRDATPQDGLFDSDSTRFYTAMLDQQMAQNLASGKGIGFAKLIEQQLGRNLPESGNAAQGAAKSAAVQGLPLSTADSRHLSGAGTTNPGFVSSQAANALGAYAKVAEAGSGNTREFVSRVWPHAVEASRSTGVPPQFLVAQAALETGWGKSEIKRADGSTSYNLFGIKAGKNWQGKTVEATTTEYTGSVAQQQKERFRAYDSYAEAFQDYANLLRSNPRYSAVIGSQDGTEFARRLQQAGYATDPAYADKLARIINGPTLRQALIG